MDSILEMLQDLIRKRLIAPEHTNFVCQPREFLLWWRKNFNDAAGEWEHHGRFAIQVGLIGETELGWLTNGPLLSTPERTIMTDIDFAVSTPKRTIRPIGGIDFAEPDADLKGTANEIADIINFCEGNANKHNYRAEEHHFVQRSVHKTEQSN